MSDDSVIGSRSVFSNERPAYSIYPPAVIRHVLFRMRANGGFFTEQEQRQRSLALRDCLSKHLNAVRDAYGVCPDRIEIVSDAGDADGKLKFSSSRSILFEVPASASFGYRLRVRADIYSELFTVTYLMDQIGLKGTGEIPRQIARLPRETATIDWLFDNVWESADFPPNTLVRDWMLHRDHPDSTREIGELVADFRSVSLYPRAEWDVREPSLEFGRIAISDETQIAPELLAFASEHQQLIRRVAGTQTDNAGGEPVVCGMAGGQALYVAELGQWGMNAQSINPIRLLLVYAGHSHSQLGRLMRRLHVVGELRHAAVLDWDLSFAGRNDDLRRASQNLRKLSNEVDEATLNSSMAKIREILPDFARINMGTEGGLSYRIERSRSYAESFLSTIPHLRITRIAGWQPYDDFVNRYIHLLFGRIDRIGLQYDELGRRLDRLMYYEQAKSLDDYQGNVKKTLDRLQELTAAQTEGGRRQEGLLGNAELFASIFCVYYLGSILKEVIYGKNDLLFYLCGINFTYNGIWLTLAAMLTVTLAFRLYKTRLRHILERKEERSDSATG